MVRHTESLIYTKCPKTLRDKKESTPSSASQPPRGAIDPIETRPDRSDPSSATIARARANTARRPPTHRAREKTIRARRASTARPRRRVVVAQPFANRTPVPRNRARPRRASKTRSHFTSHRPSNPTHTRGFGCRANDRARDAERTSPATDADATVVSHRSSEDKRSARRRSPSRERTSSSQPSWRTP